MTTVFERGFKKPGYRQEPEILPCAGGCGEMTRSNGQPAARFPNTKCRGPGGMCYKCGKAAAASAAAAEAEVAAEMSERELRLAREALVSFTAMRRVREREQMAAARRILSR